MATHKASFEVTCNAWGEGFADVGLKLPSTESRHAQFIAVAVDDSEARAGKPHITISQLDVDNTDTTAPVYTPGEVLFYTESFRPGPVTVVSVEPLVDTNDVALSDDLDSGGVQFIKTKYLRCDVDNAYASDVWNVDVYYETAGDYRF